MTRNAVVTSNRSKDVNKTLFLPFRKISNQPPESADNHYKKCQLIGKGRGEDTGLGGKLCIRMYDTQQFMLSVIAKMTNVTILIVDRCGFPMGGFSLVATQAVLSRVNERKILFRVRGDLYGGKPGKISHRTALKRMTGLAGLLKPIRMHGCLRVLFGSNIVSGVAIEAFWTPADARRPVPILPVMALGTINRTGPRRFLMLLVLHIDMTLLAGDLFPFDGAMDGAVELLHRHLEHGTFPAPVMALYAVRIGVGTGSDAR